MTEQLATTISIVVAVLATLISVAYGLTLHWLRRRSREAVPSGRPPNMLALVIFFSGTTAGGFVFLWNRPLIEPPVLQVVLFGLIPAMLGYGSAMLSAVAARSPETEGCALPPHRSMFLGFEGGATCGSRSDVREWTTHQRGDGPQRRSRQHGDTPPVIASRRPMSTPIPPGPPEDSGSTPPVPPAYPGTTPPAYSGPVPPAYSGPTPPAPPTPFGYPQPGYASPGVGQDPLAAPLYGATPVQAVSRFFRKYATFSGRASRSEYWWMQLALVVLYIGAFALSVGLAGATASSSSGGAADIVLAVVFLGTVVPALALTWRRLHDTNLPGPWYFITFVPTVGSIILICLCAQGPNPAGARFDAPPPRA